MVSMIRYVTGFPKEREPKSERFEDIRKQYELGGGNVDWNWWQTSSLRRIIDPTIREKILKEKEGGVRFTRL